MSPLEYPSNPFFFLQQHHAIKTIVTIPQTLTTIMIIVWSESQSEASTGSTLSVVKGAGFEISGAMLAVFVYSWMFEVSVDANSVYFSS